MVSISVIVCSHNPREHYLNRVLTALKMQTAPVQDWELLLIDNVSEKPLEKRFDLSWQPNARHLREEKIGKTHALLRGIAESKGELLIIVDDDNVLCPNYFENCVKIAAEHPELGSWGGSYIPEYETEPPAELRPWLYGLVVDKISEPIWAKLTTGSLALPPGAGMAVRRRVADYYREQVLQDPLRQSLDRSGKMLGSGGDSDLALCGVPFGLGAGRFPNLEVTHLISAKRLTLDYLERLFEGFGYGGVILMAVHDTAQWEQKRSPYFFKRDKLRIIFMNCLMLAARTGRAERRIKLAEERGRQAAFQELERLGDFRNLICH